MQKNASEASSPAVIHAQVEQTMTTTVVEQILPSHDEEKEENLQLFSFFPDLCAQNLPILTIKTTTSQMEAPFAAVEHLEVISKGGEERNLEVMEDSIEWLSQRLTEISSEIFLVPETQVVTHLSDEWRTT